MFVEDHPFALAYKLVREGKLDPWKVDIVELANAYLDYIRQAELLELSIPARAILAASFLLRKKMEVLFPPSPRKVERKRHYTLQELVELFQEEYPEVIEESKEDMQKKLKNIRNSTHTLAVKVQRSQRKEKQERVVPLHVSSFEDALKELLEVLKEKKNVYLSNLVNGKSIAPYLLAAMTLYYDGKINLYQEKPYSDILLEVTDGQ
ncbi:segregation/condensation protein A [Thermocrinis minervae]|uniref:Segregation and condensation protein A n=1 Tax=Thermocrinis minervae TaxID=381751 RepID=A0A1M6TLI3_9AQUI|nr:segregation/condensation protein A [Thermocrinis minervae]SHK57827.1 condensin subunit ScpA [Thermocrinis minervae]